MVNCLLVALCLVIMTNIVDDMTAKAADAVSKMPKELWKSTDQGCATTIVAALDPHLAGKNEIYHKDDSLSNTLFCALVC